MTSDLEENPDQICISMCIQSNKKKQERIQPIIGQLFKIKCIFFRFAQGDCRL